MPTALPRVLMVTPWTPLGHGGVQRHVIEVSRRLRLAGGEVEVLCSDPGGRASGDVIRDGVRIRSLRAWPADRDWCFAPGLWRAIADAEPDLIHVQSYHTLVAPLAMLRALTLGIPYVVTFHGGGHSSPLRNRVRGLQRRTLRPLLARARRLIAVARFEIGEYGQELRIPAERFVLIPNGSDLVSPDHGADAEGADQEGEGAAVIATIGRLERYKGHHRVIAALPYVLERRPEVRLMVVGSGPYEENLRAAAAAAGVTDRVEFTRVPMEDRLGMWNLLHGISMVVLLSDFETDPIVAVEAAAARRRLLVSKRGGLIDLISDGIASGIDPTASPRSVAGAILAGLDRPPPAQAPRLTSWDECTTALADVYRSIV